MEEAKGKILKIDEGLKRKIFDGFFIAGWLFTLPCGMFPNLVPVFSILMLLCVCVCIFDDNFYLFAAIFIYMRFTMVIGDSPAYRIYSYLAVIKFLTQITKLKIRPVYFPAIFVFAMHSIFAFGRIDGQMRLALNTLVDVVIIYLITLKVLSDKDLTRRFFIAFLMGGLSSGVYGWTNADVTVANKIRGAGAQEITRSFGTLSDANFAGFFYNACFYSSLMIKTIPKWLKGALMFIFLVLLLQTASLSAILVLGIVGCIVIILKFRAKSFFILLFAFVGISVALGFLLTIPQFRQIPAIQGYIIRINEKLTYLAMGRWDLLTTDRSALWAAALDIFNRKSLFGRLFGGSVITVMFIDYSMVSIAIHQSIIQGLMNFGIVGTSFIYFPLLGVILWRLYKHFNQRSGYEGEDIAIVRILFPVLFLIFGMTVDFFIDWGYLLFYFI